MLFLSVSNFPGLPHFAINKYSQLTEIAISLEEKHYSVNLSAGTAQLLSIQDKRFTTIYSKVIIAKIMNDREC